MTTRYTHTHVLAVNWQRAREAERIASTLDKRGGVRLWCRDEDGWTWQEARVEWRRTK